MNDEESGLPLTSGDIDSLSHLDAAVSSSLVRGRQKRRGRASGPATSKADAAADWGMLTQRYAPIA